MEQIKVFIFIFLLVNYPIGKYETPQRVSGQAIQCVLNLEKQKAEMLTAEKKQFSNINIDIDTKKYNYPGVAFSKNNPGSLKSTKNRKEYAKFKTFREGFIKMRDQVQMYIDGTSQHTDSTTTLRQGLIKYKGDDGYVKKIPPLLNMSPDTLLHYVHVDSLQKYILKHENCYAYKIVYYGGQ